MKTNGWIILVFGAIVAAACSKNDSHTELPSRLAEAAFRAKYPAASSVEWEKAGIYQKVEFKMNSMEYDAWFDASGKWFQTEYSLPYASLPSAVKDYVTNSFDYPANEWTPESSAEVVERLNYPVWYGVELEKGKNEVTLWTDADIFRHFDAAEDIDRSDLPQTIRGFISSNYAGGWVTEGMKLVDGSYVVNMLNDREVKQVYFNSSMVWTYTAWPVAIGDLPLAVQQFLTGEAYKGYAIKSAEYRQYTDKSYYHVTLENTEYPEGPTLQVNVDAEGNPVLAN